MKNTLERVRLRKEDVSHIEYDSDGICEVCGTGHYLIHVVRLPNAIPVVVKGETCHSSIALCTRHFKMMFQTEPNRFPKKKKEIKKLSTPVDNEDEFPRFYQLKRFMQPTMQIMGRRTCDHASHPMKAQAVTGAYYDVELFFAMYKGGHGEDFDYPTYITSCVKVLGTAFNFVVPVPNNKRDDDVLDAIYAASGMVGEILSDALGNNAQMDLILDAETTVFIRKAIGLR